MSFESLRNSVQQLWDFAWPPIVLIAVIVLLIRWLAPNTAEALRSASLAYLHPTKLRHTRALFRLYGLGKLLPIVAAFVVVFALYLTTTAAYTIGRLVPPAITTTPNELVIRNADSAALACLVALERQRSPRSSASARISAAVGKLTMRAQRQEDDRYWTERAGRNFRAFQYEKALLVLVLALVIAERRRSGKILWRRVAAVVLALTLALNSSVLFYLYVRFNADRESLFSAQRELLEAKVCTKGEEPILTEEEWKARDDLHFSDRWWHFSFQPTWYVDWLRKHLF